MTIATSARTAGPYIGAGVIGVFPFSFKVFQASDVLVTSKSTAGVTTTLVLSSDYSVSLNSDQENSPGGTVTTTAALAVGYTLIITSNVPATQSVALTNGGGFFPKVIEGALDRLTILLQQFGVVGFSQALRVPELDGVPTLPAAPDRASKLLGFNASGTPVAVAPASGSSADLALTLASSGGAALIGVKPGGGVSSTNAQAALLELDADWRAAASTTGGQISALDTRIDVLEAMPAGSGIVAKDTQATLYADLAWAAGTLGYVTNDATTTKNGFYRKTGASGSGSWVQSSTAPDSVTNAAGQLAYRIHQAIPVYGDDVIALKVADDRWLIRVPVVNGSPHDYTEFEMFQWGTYMGITHAWALHSIRARIGGVGVSYMEQHPSPGNVSTNEFAFKIGKLSDYMADATRWNNASYFDLYGFGHGHLSYLGFGLYLDGGATNYRDHPVGTELRGTTIQFSQSFGPKTPDGTVIGTHSVSHDFTAAGLQVAHQVNVTAPGIVCQNSYAAMAAFTGVNRIKATGVAATTVGAQDGSQVGNWGAKDTFAAYYDDRPTHLCEVILPYGGPIGPGGDWSQATTSKTFVLDNASRIRKLYVNWRSGAVSAASAGDTGTPPPSFSGVYSFLTTYRVRVGAAL